MPTIGDVFLSRYKITAELGAGGMGEVYLAEDGELGRRVAIKFLPKGYGADPALLRRFEREVKAAGALNHPNIITIHDAGSHDGRPFLVMEHVDGETLTSLIADNDLSIDRVLDIAIQVCEGLAAAHEAGVTHRDIKPDNILVDRKGRVRILDFGLAKLTGATALTATETTVGTASYMSPEQARGDAVDERTDLFSLGVVLYEMITGHRPFVGDHPAAVTYAILNENAQPLRRYNNAATDELESIVSKLLAKNREERYPNAAALLVDLKREQRNVSSSNRSGQPQSTRTRPGRRRWPVMLGLTLLVAVTAILTSMLTGRDTEPRRTVSFTIPQELSFHATSHPLAVSTKGELAWIGPGPTGGAPLIWIRALDQSEPRSLPGTDGAENVFWSPDGRWIGYVQEAAIKIIDAVASGPPRVLVETSTVDAPSWGSDGTILYAPISAASTDSTNFTPGDVRWIYAVNAQGGTSRPVTTSFTGEGVHWHMHPEFLPDGRHFLFVGFVRAGERSADLYIGSLDAAGARRIEGVHSRAQFMNDRLYYADQGFLVARPFDPETATFEGDPVKLGEFSDAHGPRTANSVFAARAGVVAWLDQGTKPRAIWFDRSGNELGRLDVPGTIRGADISPDGKRAADGSGTPIQLSGSVTGAAYPTHWSPDGKTIAFIESAVDVHIRFVAPERDAPSLVFADGPGWQWGARFSPDGRWVAFGSSELGSPEVFVAPRSDGQVRRRVSVAGGHLPFWTSDGRELVYVDGEGGFPARENVFYRVAFAGEPLSIGRPQELFFLEPSWELRGGDVSSDGERFLCVATEPLEAWSDIHVLVDADVGRNVTPR